MTEEADEPGRKTNIIVTYKELAGIHLSLQKLSIKLDAVDEKLEDVQKIHVDHEIRIKALELAHARTNGSTGMAQWALPTLITVGGFVLALLNYLKP